MGKSEELKIEERVLKLSNLDKVFYPGNGFTKAQVIDYYLKAAPYILPHLKNRPFTLKRYPDGVTGERFYEKNAPSFTPAWVKRFAVERKTGGEPIHYLLINDLPSLVWVANLASIELHVFLAAAPKIEQPKSIVFDLDPGESASVIECAEVALLLKDKLDQFKLESFVKCSGSKGLQLYVPLNLPVKYDLTRAFAKALAELLEKEHPLLITSEMAKNLRPGKVFIDWSQNSVSKTTVAVYSLRAKRDLPYVSMPMEWADLRSGLKKKERTAFDFPPEKVLRILGRKGDLFEAVLKLKQRIPKQFARLIKSDTEVSEEAESGPLKKYQEKRNFEQTEEPGPVVKKSPKKAPLFVIQKHAASHLHYDFRLEMDGVLKSWAVPKGPPFARAEKRLAMEVEDHPLDYARFEGTIPPGNYGAGTVMVWDIGTYEVMDGNLRSGKLHMVLHGKKLEGEWILVRARAEAAKQPWFLIKGGRDFKPPSARQMDQSVLTGRTMEKISRDNDAQWSSRER